MRSEPGRAEREARRYRREDLLRLKASRTRDQGPGSVAAGALRWGEPVLEFGAVTEIGIKGPRYRSHRAAELGDHASFEAVAEAALDGRLARRGPPSWSVDGIGLDARALSKLIPEGTHPLTTLALVVPALATADQPAFST